MKLWGMFCLNINHSFSFLVHISPSFPLELDPNSPGDMEDTLSRRWPDSELMSVL